MKYVSRYWTIKSVALAVGAVIPLLAGGQQNNSTEHPRSACFSFIASPSSVPARYRAIRAIDDRGTHQRWLLLKDPTHPTGPALLVQAPIDFSCDHNGSAERDCHVLPRIPEFSLPVIHAGDAIILSEHSLVSDTELEATALKAAAIGDPLTVRLKMGGRILRARATAPGRAVLSGAESETRP